MAKNRFLLDEDLDEVTSELDENDIENYYVEKSPKKKNYKKKMALTICAVIAVCVIVIGGMVLATLVDKYTPNGIVISLYDYYGIDELTEDKNSAIVFMNGQQLEETVKKIDGVWYFSKDFVDSTFNDKFYYDEGNDELIYTTPTKILTIPFDSQVYLIDADIKKESYVIARKQDETIYIAVDFVKERADFICEFRTAPERMIITTEYGKSEYATISEQGIIRTGATIKNTILSMGGGTYNWRVIGQEGQWTKLVTDDCQVGYIRTKEIEGSYFVTTSNDYQPPIYTSVSKPYKINLVWHAVYNLEDNYDMYPMMDETEGITTISPTWYQLLGSDGSFNSFATHEYVDYVHELGIEIWPLISDFTSVDEVNGWSEYELFAVTENRRNLIAGLMNEVETYGFDGLNIDFEKVPKDVGPHYVQFLRELSIECRKAGIVLSIDNYVPMPHTEHYDREEQGEIADYVIVMGYDEHYSGGEDIGSVASRAFVEKGIVDTLALVPAQKLINALPFYTRMWMEYTDENGMPVREDKAYGMQAALDKAGELGLGVIWSDDVGQYVAAGEVDGVFYSVWLEEEKSIEIKMQLVQQYKLAGVAGWSLGMETKEIWNVINSYNHE